ncbi:hypothetical protein N7U49_04280 [Streptomyces sp. AD2-2]|nr:hypothetical protein N7U49_04280 [Streptomyces sp. AD2-2]
MLAGARHAVTPAVHTAVDEQPAAHCRVRLDVGDAAGVLHTLAGEGVVLGRRRRVAAHSAGQLGLGYGVVVAIVLVTVLAFVLPNRARTRPEPPEPAPATNSRPGPTTSPGAAPPTASRSPSPSTS